VLYPVEKVPASFQAIVDYNPFVPFVVMWQDLFLKNHFHMHYFFTAIIYAIVMTMIGSFVYNRLKYKFAELV
jgi:lipopolysaccharide transport system permease protein